MNNFFELNNKLAIVTGSGRGIGKSLAFALANAGKSMPARIAMMAITTSSSIKVKPEFVGDFFMAKKNGPHGPLKEF